MSYFQMASFRSALFTAALILGHLITCAQLFAIMQQLQIDWTESWSNQNLEKCGKTLKAQGSQKNDRDISNKTLHWTCIFHALEAGVVFLSKEAVMEEFLKQAYFFKMSRKHWLLAVWNGLCYPCSIDIIISRRDPIEDFMVHVIHRFWFTVLRWGSLSSPPRYLRLHLIGCYLELYQHYQLCDQSYSRAGISVSRWSF